jgi:hypothetical protein
MRALIGGVILLFISAAACLAQGPSSQNETILIPIVVPPDQEVPGAFGSRWTGEVWLRNGSERMVGRFQGENGCAECVYPPGTIAELELTTWQSAALVSIPRQDIDGLSLNARLFELSRRSQPQGVEVPIVRERDLLVAPVHLLGIPLAEGSRAAVRIFDPFPSRFRPSFRVEVVAEEGGAVLASAVLETAHDPGLAGLPGPFPRAWTPAFAMIPDLRLEFPQLLAEDRVHIRISPEGPFSVPPLYWTMASVTDNETQHVLLVTPQCCSPTPSGLP